MPRRIPHVLLVAFHFPPARGSGVYRIRAWANHLARNGWEVTVLTVAPDFYPDIIGELDHDLESTIDARVAVEHVRFRHGYLRRDVEGFGWWQANLPGLYARVWRRIPRLFFPEIYGHLVPGFVVGGLRVHGRKKVDLVLATGNPYAQLGAARLLGRLLRRPFVVDYHDSWTLDQFTGKDAMPPDADEWKAERKIVSGAALVVTVNPPIAEWLARRYPGAADRVRVVENGFADDVVGTPDFAPVDPGRPLRFGSVGTIRSDLPMQDFLAGWRLAREQPELRDATFELYGYLGFFVWNAPGMGASLKTAEVDGVRYGGPVSQTRLHEVYGRLDVLVMLLPGSPYVTSGKVYDYVASGRPIVAAHDPSNHTTEALADYPLAFPVAAVTPEEIAAALVSAARAARAETREDFEAARAHAMRHTWDARIAPVAAELRGLVGG